MEPDGEECLGDISRKPKTKNINSCTKARTRTRTKTKQRFNSQISMKALRENAHDKSDTPAPEEKPTEPRAETLSTTTTL